MVRFRFEAEIIYWRGPSPFFYAPIPPQQAREIRELSKLVTYGWGMIPVEAVIGGVAFTTSLFPKDDTYLLPLKAAVRRQAGITAGDSISVDMTVAASAASGMEIRDPDHPTPRSGTRKTAENGKRKAT